MKNILLLMLLIASPLTSQTLDDPPPSVLFPSYCTTLNGAQYWGLSSPAAGSLDLNGSEMLTNPTFDANVTGWSSSGGALSYQTAVKRTGAGAALVISNGTAYGVFNSTSISNASTQAYTCEIYAYTNNAGRSARVLLSNQAGATIGVGATTNLAAGALTRLVANIRCPGTQTGIVLTVQYVNPSSGDSIWYDDASLTQSYDCISSGIFNASATGIMDIFNSSKSASSAFRFYLNNTTPTVSVSDGTNTVTATNSATVNDGKNHFWSAYLNRTGNLTLSIDGVAGTGVGATGLGKITVDTVRIGRGVFTNYFTGTVGQTIFAKTATTTDYTSWVTQSIANMKAGRPLTAPIGTVLNVDWKNSGRDNSGLGNNLLPFGGAVTRKK